LSSTKAKLFSVSFQQHTFVRLALPATLFYMTLRSGI